MRRYLSLWLKIAATLFLIAAPTAAVAQQLANEVRPWTEADTAASRAWRAANPAPPPTPMPPRPSGYEGLSDRDLYLRLSGMMSGVRGVQQIQTVRDAIGPAAWTWMREYGRRQVEAYVEARDAGRLPSQQVAPAPIAVAAVAPPAPARSYCDGARLRPENCDAYFMDMWNSNQHNRDPQAMVRNWDQISDGIKAAVVSSCQNLRTAADMLRGDYVAEVGVICADFGAQARTYARQQASPSYGSSQPYAASVPASPGSSVVRTYDARSGMYTGSEVMSDLEAELRGASPR